MIGEESDRQGKLDELYSVMVEMAFALLEKNGEFFPIGAVVSLDSAIQHVATYDGDEHPESQMVIDQLTQLFCGQANEGAILASAIAFDARLRSPETGEAVDAIMIRLRAKDYARDVAMPYELRTSGFIRKTREVEAGQASASEGRQDIFT